MRLPQANDRQRAIASNRAAGLETGLQVSSYPLGGVVAYGLIGWLISALIHATWPIPAGMFFGLVVGTGYVIYRYGTQAGIQAGLAHKGLAHTGSAHTGLAHKDPAHKDPRKEMR